MVLYSGIDSPVYICSRSSNFMGSQDRNGSLMTSKIPLLQILHLNQGCPSNKILSLYLLEDKILMIQLVLVRGQHNHFPPVFKYRMPVCRPYVSMCLVLDVSNPYSGNSKVSILAIDSIKGFHDGYRANIHVAWSICSRQPPKMNRRTLMSEEAIIFYGISTIQSVERRS